MHDGAVIVTKSLIESLVGFEVVLILIGNVIPKDGDVSIAVASALFVPETESVHKLVLDGSGAETPAAETQVLSASEVAAHGGVATASVDDVDVVRVGSNGRANVQAVSIGIHLSHERRESIFDLGSAGGGNSAVKVVGDSAAPPKVLLNVCVSAPC